MRIRTRVISAVMMLSLLLPNVPIFAPAAGAATTVNAATPLPPTTPETGTPLFNNGAYRESTITYTGKSTYFFATQNPAYANGSTVYVTFDGTSGSVATSGTADGSTVFASTVIYLDGGNYTGTTGATSLARANSTVFMDAGTYFETNPASYVNLSATNLALIGLNNGDVIMKSQPYLKRSSSTATPQQLRERVNINNPGVRYQNLIFDADGAGLVSNNATTASATAQWSRDNGATWLTSGTVFTTSRGGTLLAIGGANSALIKDCTLRNIGPAETSSVANNAFNVMTGSTGQVNVEGLTVDNCWGSTNDTFRLVNIAPATNVNIKDLTFNQGSGQLREPIRLETPGSTTTAAVEQATDVRFAGSLTFNGYEGRQRIGMQLTSFKNLTLPDGYRYATVSPLDLSTLTQVLAYKSLDDFNAGAQAVLDIQDNAWLVRQPQTGVVTATVNQQLANINTILTRLGQPLSTTVSRNFRGMASNAFIKMVAGSDATLPGFTVPSNTLATATGPRVFIKAVSSPDVQFSASDALVPLTADTQIALSAPNNADVRLYNIDYSARANYTLEAAINGISSETTPTPAQVAGSTVDTFAASRFTVLAQGLDLSVPLNADDDSTVGGDGTIYTVSADLAPFSATAAITQAFTLAADGFEQVTPSADFAVDDPSISWESSDPAVATVDADTGLVTVVDAGTVTITARANDVYNSGEIVRPQASFTLLVQPLIGTVVASYVNTDGVQMAEDTTLSGPVGTPFALQAPAFDGYFLQSIDGPTSGVYVNGTVNVTFTYAPIPTAGDVTFESNGGSDVISIAVNPDGTLVQPADPVKPGFVFSGWYKDAAFTTPWDFANDTIFTPVTPESAVRGAAAAARGGIAVRATAGISSVDSTSTSFTLYAKWLVDPETPVSDLVTLDSGGGTDVVVITINPDGTIVQPADPVRFGYTFTGWFHDSEGTTPWDFDTDTVNALNTTLYAGWVVDPAAPSAEDIIFDSQGGSEVGTATINPDGTIVKPTDPVKDGYTFGGWYLDAAGTIPWDFANDTVTTEGFTLYAKWTEEDTGPGSEGPGGENPGGEFPGPGGPGGGTGTPGVTTPGGGAGKPGSGVFATPGAKLPATGDRSPLMAIAALLALTGTAGALFVLNARRLQREK